MVRRIACELARIFSFVLNFIYKRKDGFPF